MNADAVQIADRYLDVAYLSLTARLKRSEQEYRYTSRGLLLALEVMLGLDDALRLIEERSHTHRYASQSIDALLYNFWKLDRPKERV